MLGAFHIFLRQVAELGHRRKLAGFLFLLPLLLMVLFGAALGGENVPVMPDGSQLASVNQVRNDQSLATLLGILGPLAGGHGGPVRVLAASFRSPTNASATLTLYVVPSGQNTSVVVVDEGSSAYYYAVFDNNGSRVETAAGPRPLPVLGSFAALPLVDLQPLYSSENDVKLARAALAIFRIGLVFELNQRRLLDVLFPEIVGLEVGWVGVLGSAVGAVEDRVSGARRRILMSPVSRIGFVLGSAMASFFLISLQLAILFATAIFIFNVNIAGSIVDLLPVIAAAVVSVIGVGLIISHFSRTPDEAFYLSTLVNLPMGFLSSQYIPLSHGALSVLVQSALPMTYANKALSMVMVGGASLQTVLPQLVSLGIFAAVLYSLGTIMVMRER
ncbi:hypothetical protein AUG19_02850 [archaeon 13_1_20CM_2_54_9]|nr:MAG: hypothetical protein AUG19_02850 [archaeon 13_1_20CM_2_54_9]TMI24586.1 MAG: ABC transporter permease [Candidatus Bathyarchaeota archaeon]TMI30387.1 MAG: ABC transporter permease [Candidatus Bathyarchaeota archaeon]